MEVINMITNLSTRETDTAVGSSAGSVWNRLHSEREEICEALLKEPQPGLEANSATRMLSKEEAVNTISWHRDLLQARLRKIDDALDRLMSGSYGDCVKCGRWIEDTKLDFDPAIAFCVECWQRIRSQERNPQPLTQEIRTSDLLDNLMRVSPSLPGVVLETLDPFDTISVRTRNSEYRLFLLDPKAGRALLEGGRQFVEPVEAIVNGSTFGGSTLKCGWIGVGMRMELWVKDHAVSTSPVQSIRVDRLAYPSSVSDFTTVH